MESEKLLKELFGDDTETIQNYIEFDSIRIEHICNYYGNSTQYNQEKKKVRVSQQTIPESKIMINRLEDLINKKKNKNNKRNTRNSKKTKELVDKLSDIKQVCGWEDHLV